MMRAAWGLALGLAVALAACDGEVGTLGAPTAASGQPVDFGPELRPYSDVLAGTLRVPAGFKVRTFATGLDGPAAIAAAGAAIFVTLPASGRVLRLADGNGDGDADDPGEVGLVADAGMTPGLTGVRGVAISGDAIYLVGTSNVMVGTFGGLVADLHELGAPLPAGGEDDGRAVAVGPDGNVYVSVGGDCNACREEDSEDATLLRLTPDGAAADNPPNPKHPVLAQDPLASVSPRVFASGLREMLGFDWDPLTGTLWGADNGTEGLGTDSPPEEINLLAGGKSYGWPYCWADERVDPNVPDPSRSLSKATYCDGTMVPLSTLPPHSHPGSVLFYRGGQFPAPYVNDAFIALRGSRGEGPASGPSGFSVIRLHFTAGQPAAIPGTSSSVQEFLTGFLLDGGFATFGRPTGLTVDHLGALLVSDQANGVIYRVTYEPETVALPPPTIE
jgi:glucose/arabinose dehydrogenase